MQDAPRGIAFHAGLVVPGASSPPSGTLAAAAAMDSAPEKGFPLAFLLCGLGEQAGEILNFYYKGFAELTPEPFVLVVARRHPKWWWFVDDASDGGWVKGKLDPSMVEEMAAWMQKLMEDDSVDKDRTGLFGFSAGGYAALEILATGKILFSGFAVGGVHGHGQCNLVDLPARWCINPLEKFKAFLERVGQHEGAMWMEATHSLTDMQSKWEDAARIIGALDARQKDLGMAGVQLRILSIEEQDCAPSNKRNKSHHDYFKASFMRREFLVALFGGDAPEERELPDGVRLILPEEAFDQEVTAAPSDVIVQKNGKAIDDSAGVVDLRFNGGDEEDEDDGQDADSAAQELIDNEDDLGDDDGAAEEVDEWLDEEEDQEQEEQVLGAAATGSSGSLAPGMQAPPRTTLDVSEHSVSSIDFDWEARALELFNEHGFVIVEDALTEDQCSAVLQDCRRLEKTMVTTSRKGNRGPGRYSFGNASSTSSMLHRECWALHLLEGGCSTLLPLLERIFAADDPAGCFVQAGGGDFVVDRTETMQEMHADIHVKQDYSKKTLVPPWVCVNFCVQDLTELNGAMRIFPGTQRKFLDHGPKARQHDNSRICPVRAGAAIVRDVRVWHSGTPNVSTKTRFLPSIEFVSNHFREWARANNKFSDWFPTNNALPRHLYDQLSPEIQELCRNVVARKGQKVNPTIQSH